MITFGLAISASLVAGELKASDPKYCTWLAKKVVGPESCVSKCHEFCIANPGEYMCSGQQVHNDTAAGNKYDKSNTKE